MNFHLKANFKRWGISLLVLMISVLPVHAADWYDDFFEASFDPSGAYTVVNVCYFTTYGGAGDGHQGFHKDEGAPGELSCNGNTIKFNCNSDGGSLSVWGQNSDVKWSTFRRTKSNGEYGDFIEFKIPVRKQDIGNKTITLKGHWWSRGIGSADMDLNKSRNVNNQIDLSDVKFTDSYYDSTNPRFYFKYSSNSNKNCDPHSKIYVYNGDGGSEASESGSMTSSSNYRVMTASLLAKNETFTIRREYYKHGGNLKLSTEGTLERPAYPQVSGAPKLTVLPKTHQLKVEFSIPAAPSNYYDDYFKVELKMTGLGNDKSVKTLLKDVRYNVGTKNYECYFDLPEETDHQLEVWVARRNVYDGSGWQQYKMYKKITAKFKHQMIDKAEAILAKDMSKATLAWDISGDTWSDNSKLVIRRYINKDYGSFEEFELNYQQAIEDKKWVDTQMTACQGYSYDLRIVPGGSFQPKGWVRTVNYKDSLTTTPSEEIIPTSLGKVLDVKSTKGFLADGVELKWGSEGAFDYFNVSRRVYDETNKAKFEFVAKIDGNSDVDGTFKYKDKDVRPSVLYEYEIQGFTQCYSELLSVKYDGSIFGFRTATNEIHGRVSYESGQGVKDVDMRLSSDAPVSRGYSLKFAGGNSDYLQTDDEFSQKGTDYTFQALVRPATTGSNGTIMEKGNYILGLKEGVPFFKAGTNIVTANEALSTGRFSSVSAGYISTTEGEKIFLIVYGNEGRKIKELPVGDRPELIEDTLYIGKGFKGHIDEVRVWNKGLTAEEIDLNHNCLLGGGEFGLAGYYRFNEPIKGNFFDFSYYGLIFNERHGKIKGNVTFDNGVVPTADELAFGARTDEEGNYHISNVLYEGSGTSYTLTPKKGIHKFKYSAGGQEQGYTTVIVSETKASALDFVDISSFKLEGTVYYEDTEIPVAGVQFMVDGVYATDVDGQLLATGKDGTYSLSVPIGKHQVKAVKNQHKFVNGGKLLDHNGENLDYQGHRSGINFYDATKVKLIGRIAGGDVQMSKPVGFSKSRNNLGHEVVMTLAPLDFKNKRLTLNEVGYRKDTVKHFVADHENVVVTTEDDIKVYVDPKTGEYVANLIPEKFNVTSVKISGFLENFAQGASNTIDLTNKLAEMHSVLNPLATDGTEQDTVYYNEKYMHPIINEPNFSYKEVYVRKDEKDSVINVDKGYFGNEYENVSVFNEEGKTVTEKVLVYDKGEKKYMFDNKPVYKSKAEYNFLVSAFMPFYYDNIQDEEHLDMVPIINGEVKVENTMKDSICTIKINNRGEALYTFRPDNPDVNKSNNGVRNIEFTLTSNGRTYPSKILSGFVLGSKGTGANFVTEGPTKLLMVLRDPPGSHSYTYTSETVTTTHENSGNVNFMTSNEVMGKVLGGFKVEQSVGAPGAEIVTEIASGEFNIGTSIMSSVNGQEELSGARTYTFDSQFRTSADPDYVGRDADLLIGNSTNVIIGTMNTLGFKPIETLSAEDRKNVIFENNGFALCVNKAISAEEQFATMFAYPQIHIEDVLIPQCDELISQLLEKGRGLNPAQAKAKANELNEAIFVPHLSKSDANYGLSNPNGADLKMEGGHAVGDYYDIYYSDEQIQKFLLHEGDLKDSLLTIEISKNNWIDVLRENERQKIEAFKDNPDQNLSYQGGATVEQSMSYTSTLRSTTTSNYQLTMGFLTEISGTVSKVGTKMEVKEEGSVGGGLGYTYDKGNTTSVGFVLEDTGGDYMSVDVYKPNIKSGDAVDKMKSSGYIFRLRGGATAGPFEGVQLTKYFEPGKHKLSEGSLQIENPVLSVSPANVVNVPADKPAVFTLKMYNESEAQSDCVFDLKLVDASNANGAKFSIDGVSLGSGRPFEVPYGDILTKKLEVKRGAEEFDYENLKLVLVSQSQGDPFSNNGAIADTITLSAHFVPSSTAVNIKSPGDGWTLNVKSEGNEEEGFYMPVLVDGFDINDPKFDRIELLYKPASEPLQWTKLRTFYKDESRELEENEEFIGNKTILTAQFRGQEDQRYDIKAVSYTKYGEEFVTNESKVVSGVKDTQRPQLFGLPTPANGILNLGEVIGLTFNEEIAGGYLARSNFEITAVKNGAKNDRSVSVKMDGVNDAIVSEFGKDWSNRSLTINGWVKFEDLAAEQSIFALGELNNGCTLKYMGQSGKFNFASNDGKSFNLNCTVKEALKAGAWYNIAAVIDYDAESVYLYLNYDEIGAADINNEYKCDGKVFLGRDVQGLTHFKGWMDDFRIWDKAMGFSDIKITADRRLSGAEPSLVAYYPMDEARGKVVLDKARGNNASLVGDWTTPDGYALSFDGKDDILVINSGEVPVNSNEDFTLEFWFKSNDAAQNATLIGNGSADGADFGDGNGLLRVAIENGQLVVCTGGHVEKIAGSYNDKNWHHFLLTVNRIGGYAQVYVDEKLAHYFNGKHVGEFGAAKLYAGARRYEKVVAAAGQTTTDQYFNGMIDEIRLWKNSFTQASVENNANNLMNGNEMGLIAYYPFEEWVDNVANFRELVPSLKEKVNKKTEAVAEGQLLNTKTEHAPLVEGGVAENVAYEFVANKESLILNLTEPEESIDNTILNIAVTRVFDVNGNPMDGVVRWSAFVDRNPIRWADTKKNVDIKQGEETAFTVALNNTSGVVKNFTLEGVPAWMEVSPMSGKLEPNTSVDVHFTVSSGANVGRYDEMIYARGDNNVAAALPLNVKVNGHKPDWKVDTNKYEHNMSIFGQMLFDGAISNDKEDIVAIFNNGECVGLSNSVYDKKRDMWYTYLTVYADEIPTTDNDLKDLYEFRMWDASTGQLYSGSVNSLVFENGICGSLADLVQISGQEIKIRDLSLNEGWNWVSFAVLPQTANSNVVLKNGVWNKDDVIKNASSFDSYSAVSNKWEGTLSDTYDRTQMYMLRTTNAQSLNIEGTEKADAKVHVVGQRWNYIGYTPKFNLSVNEAMAGYRAEEGDVLKSQTQFAMFTDGDWVGSLKFMEVNKGYMLYRKAAGDVDFAYPSIRGSYSNVKAASLATFANVVAEKKYANNLTIVATPAYSELEEGDIIKAYVNGELRGYSQIVNRDDKQLHFLTISGSDEGENVVFSLERDGEEVAKSSTVVPFSTNATMGSVTKALEISFDASEDNVHVYPNPFVSYLNIQFFAEKDGQAEISIYDLSGRLMMQKSLQAHAGVNKYTWHAESNNAAQIAGGLHLVRVTVDGKTTVHEVIKK